VLKLSLFARVQPNHIIPHFTQLWQGRRNLCGERSETRLKKVSTDRRSRGRDRCLLGAQGKVVGGGLASPLLCPGGWLCDHCTSDVTKGLRSDTIG